MCSDASKQNDVRTISGLVSRAYLDAVNRKIIRVGFYRTVIWSNDLRSCDPSAAKDSTNLELDTGVSELISYHRSLHTEQDEGPIMGVKQLMEERKGSGRVFLSDGVVEKEGRVRLRTSRGIQGHFQGAVVMAGPAFSHLQLRDMGKEAEETAIRATAESKFGKESAKTPEVAREAILTEQNGMNASQRKDHERLVKREDKETENASTKEKERFRQPANRRNAMEEMRTLRRLRQVQRVSGRFANFLRLGSHGEYKVVG